MSLAPEQVVSYLEELQPNVDAFVLLDLEGNYLAGHHGIAAAARELLFAVDNTCPQMQIKTPDGFLFLVRSDRYVFVAATSKAPLPGLILHDLRVALNDLVEGEGV